MRTPARLANGVSGSGVWHLQGVYVYLVGQPRWWWDGWVSK